MDLRPTTEFSYGVTSFDSINDVFYVSTAGGIFGFDVATLVCSVCANGGTLVKGFGEINDFGATCDTDDSYWAAHGDTFAFQVSDPVSQFEFVATAPAGFSEGTISIDIEASKEIDEGNLNLRALLFNFATGGYEALLETMPLTTSDATQDFELPAGSNPNDFVDPGTNDVRLLIQTVQSSGLPNVRTQVDEVLFNFEQ